MIEYPETSQTHSNGNGFNKTLKIITLVVAMLGAVATHTGALVWTISSMQTTIDFLQKEKDDLKKKYEEIIKEQYTQTDADRDHSNIYGNIHEIRGRLSRFENLKFSLKP